MTSSIAPTTDERTARRSHLRRSPTPDLRLRAHLVLRRADGGARATIAAVRFWSSRTSARWQRRSLRGRGAGGADRDRAAPAGWAGRWAAVGAGRVTDTTPRAFGFFRRRWSRALLAPVLGPQHQAAVGREAIRRWLHPKDLARRRPRPVLGRCGPDRQAKLQGGRQLLRDLPANAAVVFGGEGDVNPSPKIGGMWMPKGKRAEVVAPGGNAKGSRAGSLNGRTGAPIATPGPKRDGEPFVRPPHDLRRRLRRYRKVHAICDNAGFHTGCWPVWEVVAKHGDRVVLHFRPTDAPDCNPIARVWWALHEQIARNHRCKNLDGWVELVVGWLDDREVFPVADDVYAQPKAG